MWTMYCMRYPLMVLSRRFMLMMGIMILEHIWHDRKNGESDTVAAIITATSEQT